MKKKTLSLQAELETAKTLRKLQAMTKPQLIEHMLAYEVRVKADAEDTRKKLKEDVEALQAELETAKEDVEALQAELETAEAKISELQAKVPHADYCHAFGETVPALSTCTCGAWV